MTHGLDATAARWAEVRPAYDFVHRAAHILANHDEQASAQVRSSYDDLLAAMAAERDQVGSLAPAIDHFLKVTASYRPGLFACYDVPDLPRTNNDREHLFGATRYLERRASGRKLASPTLVVRGAVRLIAAVVTRSQPVAAADLELRDLQQWRTLRATLDERHNTRRAQRRFRRDPDAYLAHLENELLKDVLPP